MKILLDKNLPHALRKHLPGYDVFTVGYMGWAGTKNGALLQLAADNDFDVLMTKDMGVSYQQNIQHLSLAVIVVSAPTNDLDDILPLLTDVLVALNHIQPGTIVRVQ